ncbi:hypothetical protein ABQH43_01715 [Streptococcus sp. ZJ100]|uniref:hypothetical protein n=1 Tax=Streptococcus handemini TaxID=3161188 RepID=UPI0032EFD41C
MNENLYTHMLADVCEQLKTKTLESAEYRARWNACLQEIEWLHQVLESDEDLKELFDEQAKKLETQEG